MSNDDTEASRMTDDQLLAAVRGALETLDAPPPGLRDAGVRALTWDTERLTLADLVHDSADGPAMAGMRGAVDTAPRDLVFQRGDVTLDISIEPSEDGTGARVSGLVLGVPDGHVVQLRVPGRGTTEVQLDTHGRFAAQLDGRRVVVVVPGGAPSGGDLRTDVLPLR